MKKFTKKTLPILIGSLLLYPSFTVHALKKSETVYANLDYNGNVLQSSVTNHLFSKDSTNIEDQTALRDILNINGKEPFIANGNKLLWNGNGKDIFYRGWIEKELPIAINISYSLNGKEINPLDIVGKSGEIKVRFSFQNHEKNNTKVNGKNLELSTPFVVTMGMILNSDTNSNIEITNGKIVDTGTKNMIVGIAAPGMYDNFKIKELESLEEIILTYQTTDFSQGDIYVVATPKLLEENDLKIFEKVNQLTANISTLQTSMNTIVEGVSALENGSKSLIKGSNEITTNLKSALDAMKKLENGSQNLENGIKQVITELNKASSNLKNPKTTGSITQLKTLKQKNTQTIQLLTNKTGMNYESLMSFYKTNLIQYTGDDETFLALKSNCKLPRNKIAGL